MQAVHSQLWLFRERGNGTDYINLAKLINHAGTGILQKIEPIETEIFARSEQALNALRENGPTAKETAEFYHWIDIFLKEQYKRKFGIELRI